MDGVLTILYEPSPSVDFANPMPDDSLPSPEPHDKRAAHRADSDVPHDANAALPHPPVADGSNGGADDGRSTDIDDRQPSTDNPEPTADTPIEIIPMRVVEAILFASDSPLPPAKIASILGVGDARDVRKHIAALNEHYEAAGNAFRVEEIAGGFRMMTLPAFNRWLTKLLRTRQETKLTGAAMETLAIVAYKQPCTRADIEAVRGVAAGDILNRLREMNMIKIVGRAEDLGRPLLYGTTKRFLEVFGLAGLEDLPQVDALKGGGGGSMPATPPKPVAMEVAEAAMPQSEPRVEAGEPIAQAMEPPTLGLTHDDAVETPVNDETAASDLGQLPHEASADLATPPGNVEDHPPAKAVVTRRTRKPKKTDPDTTTE